MRLIGLDSTRTCSMRLIGLSAIPAVYRNRKRLCRHSLFSAVFIFSAPAQECSWLHPSIAATCRPPINRRPLKMIREQLAPLGEQQSPWHAGRWYLLVGRRALFDRASGRATLLLLLPGRYSFDFTLALCIRSQWSSFLLSIFDAAPLARVVLQPLRPLPNFNM